MLGPRDAVVVFGCTPPTSDYFGYQTNVMARWADGTADADADSGGGHGGGGGGGHGGTPAPAPAPAPGLWFPEVTTTESLNQLILNTTNGWAARSGADQDSSPAPFTSAFVAVTTADRRTFGDVSRAFVAAGLSEARSHTSRLLTLFPPTPGPGGTPRAIAVGIRRPNKVCTLHLFSVQAALNLDALDRSAMRFWDDADDGGLPWPLVRPDTLTTVSRFNNPQDRDAAARFAAHPQPALLLRERRSAAQRPAEPLPPPALRARTTAAAADAAAAVAADEARLDALEVGST